MSVRAGRKVRVLIFMDLTSMAGLPFLLQFILVSLGSRFQVRILFSGDMPWSFFIRLKNFLPLMGLMAMCFMIEEDLFMELFFFLQRSLMTVLTWAVVHFRCSERSFLKWNLKKEMYSV